MSLRHAVIIVSDDNGEAKTKRTVGPVEPELTVHVGSLSPAILTAIATP